MTIVDMETPNEIGLQQVAANERLTFFGLTLPYLLMVTALIVIQSDGCFTSHLLVEMVAFHLKTTNV